MENVEIGRYSRIRRAIIDKNVIIRRISVSNSAEKKMKIVVFMYHRGGGIMVVPKGTIL